MEMFPAAYVITVSVNYCLSSIISNVYQLKSSQQQRSNETTLWTLFLKSSIVCAARCDRDPECISSEYNIYDKECVGYNTCIIPGPAIDHQAQWRRYCKGTVT